MINDLRCSFSKIWEKFHRFRFSIHSNSFNHFLFCWERLWERRPQEFVRRKIPILLIELQKEFDFQTRCDMLVNFRWKPTRGKPSINHKRRKKNEIKTLQHNNYEMLENRNSEGWDYKSRASQCEKFQKLIKNSNTKKVSFARLFSFSFCSTSPYQLKTEINHNIFF